MKGCGAQGAALPIVSDLCPPFATPVGPAQTGAAIIIDHEIMRHGAQGAAPLPSAADRVQQLKHQLHLHDKVSRDGTIIRDRTWGSGCSSAHHLRSVYAFAALAAPKQHSAAVSV